MAQQLGWRRMWAWIAPQWLPLTLGFVCIAVVVAVDIALPKLLGDLLIDEILITRTNPVLLTWLALGGILLFTAKGIFVFGQVYLMSLVGQKVVCQLRSKMVQSMLAMPLGHHMRQKTGTLIARMTSDVGVIQNAVTAGVADLVRHVITLLAIVVMLFVVNWRLALISFLVFPLVSLAIQAYGNRVRNFTTRLQERIAGLTATLQESLEGIRIVKAFSMESERRRRFEDDNRKSYGASMKSAQAMATVAPVVELILIAGMMVVLWYGGREVLVGAMTPGGLITFLAYLAMATRPLEFVTKSFNILQQARSASARIQHVLDMPKEGEGGVVADGLTREIADVEGRMEFDNVSFAYEEGRPVLHNVTLTVEPGQMIALVGPSGAGKSTLVNLIPRFYLPDAGTIRLDGVDLREWALPDLRGLIGLVPQETTLFGMSVAENIRAGREWISDEAVEQAARVANAHDFISELPDGYNTVVGERGATLSGGQRQRIAIARAVVGDPKILILDEATSALDAESEALVRDALVRVRENRTSFVIAHRLSTVRDADVIVVMERGRIVEMGTHDELMARGRLYPRLYYTQFGNGAMEEDMSRLPVVGAGESAR